jgi:hypothetical protein
MSEPAVSIMPVSQFYLSCQAQVAFFNSAPFSTDSPGRDPVPSIMSGPGRVLQFCSCFNRFPRTRSKGEEVDEAQVADLARIAELSDELKALGDIRREALGCDRHGSRYWLLGADEAAANPGVAFIEQVGEPVCPFVRPI